jgi:hypothetical protein
MKLNPATMLDLLFQSLDWIIYLNGMKTLYASDDAHHVSSVRCVPHRVTRLLAKKPSIL